MALERFVPVDEHYFPHLSMNNRFLMQKIRYPGWMF